jgi:hypothetical protein
MTEVTYEEYKIATRFAQFRYKYGLFVLIGCWICLILLIVYTVVYAKELSTHPARYTMEKMDLNECYCNGDDARYYINRTSIVLSEGRRGLSKPNSTSGSHNQEEKPFCMNCGHIKPIHDLKGCKEFKSSHNQEEK